MPGPSYYLALRRFLEVDDFDFDVFFVDLRMRASPFVTPADPL
jgi:hypothetical protein